MNGAPQIHTLYIFLHSINRQDIVAFLRRVLPDHDTQPQQQRQAPAKRTQKYAGPEAQDTAERYLLDGRGVEGAAVFREGCFGVAGIGVGG